MALKIQDINMWKSSRNLIGISFLLWIFPYWLREDCTFFTIDLNTSGLL